MLKVVNYSLVDLSYPTSQIPISSTRVFIEVLNNTFLDVYACDFDGNRTLCSQIQPVGFTQNTLIIRFRAMNRGMMTEEAKISYPKKEKKYTHCQVEIPVKELQTGNVFYIKELGYTFSINEQDVLLKHPKLDLTIQKKIDDSVAQRLDGHQDAIVKCIINDPLGRFRQAYIGLYGHVFQTKVLNKENLEARCDIYCRNLNGEYDVYSVDIEDVAKGLCEFSEFPEGSLCISSEKESVHAWIFRNKGKAAVGFSKEEIEKIEKDLKKYYESIIGEKDEEIKTLKHRNDILNNTFQTRLSHEMMLSKHKHETNQFVNTERMEELKFNKEVVSAKSADITATSNIVKAAGIIIPAVIGLAVFFSKQAAAATSAAAMGPIGWVVGAGMCFCKLIGSGLSWIVNLFF